MKRAATAAAVLLLLVSGVSSAWAAEPVRIGITTILSGPFADRGQSEQYGAQLALDQINQAGGVLGRPVEVFYADNACKPDIGVPATRRLIEQEHVPVIIGALCTPVTHAIMPIVAQAEIPLIIATSAGQDFVDASGVGGNPYAFKTIPSEVDIADGLIKWLGTRHVKSVAVVYVAGGFPQLSALAMARSAQQAGMKVTAQVSLPATGSTDFATVLKQLKDGSPDQLITVLGPLTAPFFKAYEASGWKVPVSGRVDLAAARAAVSPEFRAAAGLSRVSSVAVFTPEQNRPGIQKFVNDYEARYGLVPSQRAFFVHEAVLLAVDAIRRAGSDQPAAIEQALRTTTMPSMLGGTYAPDSHNHAHTPLQIVALKDGKPAVISTVVATVPATE
jgi:branched-chain amino acid transport system substrate-binding protein